MTRSVAKLLDQLSQLMYWGRLDAQGCRYLLIRVAECLRSGSSVRVAFRSILSASHRRTNPRASISHSTTPCCGQPIFSMHAYSTGQPLVRFDPFSQRVKCYHCHAVWGPISTPISER